MKNIILGLLLSFLLSSILTAAGNIAIKKNIIIKNDRITMADVLETEDKEILKNASEIVIGYLSKYGEQTIIKGEYLKLKLKQLKGVSVDKVKMPDEVAVTRETQYVDNETIKSFVMEKLTEFYDAGFDIKINMRDIDKIAIPQGEITISIPESRFSDRKPGRYNFICDLIVDSKLIKKINIGTEIGRKIVVSELKSDVKKGEIFNDSFVNDQEKIFYNENEYKYFIGASELFGKVFKRNMKKGDIVKNTDFEKRKLFKKNDKVTIIANYNGIMLKTEGKALQDGIEGEQVLILNEESKKNFRGIVQTDGSVKVEIE